MLLKPGDLVWVDDSTRWSPLWKEFEDSLYLGLPVAKFDDAHPLPQQTPVTVLRTDDRSLVTTSWLKSTLEAIEKHIAFNLIFTTTLVFISHPDSVTIEAAANSWMESQNIEWRSFVTPSPQLYESLMGPHVAYQNMLWRIFKVNVDNYGAFLLGLEPRKLRDQKSTGTQYETLSVAHNNYHAMGIVVPCRSIQPSVRPCSLPLAGLRIAVKDVYRFKGLRTSLCNRAYHAVDSPALETAPIINILVNAGAHIIGITKLSSMIGREEPIEAVDYHMAFNPRADGYQSPAGSSNGSAVAVAAYDWVDLAIGTDTTGSGRRPALVNGVFQLRPTLETMCVDGMVPTFAEWDTPCLYGRDLEKFREVVSCWRSLKASPPKYTMAEKMAVIFPEDYFPVSNKTQMSLIRGFIDDLSKTLGVIVTRVSISSTWDEQPPSDANGESVEEYLRTTAVHGYWHDFYHSTHDFREHYRGKYHAEPFVTPAIHYRWNIGAQVTEQQHQEALRRLSVYRQWFLHNIMKVGGYRCILILPVANVEPNYIDTPPSEPKLPEGFDQLLLPPILGAPDVFVPLGESAYLSRISQRQEYLPVGVDVVGTPGSDLWLIDVIQECLRSSKRPERVCTGPRMFADQQEGSSNSG